MRESTFKEACVGSKKETPEIWRLLLQCGAESIADLTSRPVPPGVATPDFTTDEREPMTKEEYLTLLDPFWNPAANPGRFWNSFSHNVGFPNGACDYWLERAVASGKRVPARFLNQFMTTLGRLNIPKRSFSLIGGRYGRWTMEQEIIATGSPKKCSGLILSPEIFESSPDEREATRVWREGADWEGADWERVEAFKQIRGRNPSRAIELLREDWKKIKGSDVKQQCLDSLSVGLSEKDVDALQELEQKARSSAQLMSIRDLLARIPTSGYAQSLIERAERLLKAPEAIDKLENLKEEFDDYAYEAPDASTKRSAFLTLNRVPLAKWEEILSASPSEIRARFADRKNCLVVSQAIQGSFALFGASDEWFEVCCQCYFDLLSDNYKRTHCDPYALEATERFKIAAFKSGRADYFKRLLALWNAELPEQRFEFEFHLLLLTLRHAPYPWSEELARAFCETLIVQIVAAPEDVLRVQRPLDPRRDSYFRTRAGRLFCALICYCPRKIREEFRSFVMNGVGGFDFATICRGDEYKPNGGFIFEYTTSCALREKFDRLFGTPEENV